MVAGLRIILYYCCVWFTSSKIFFGIMSQDVKKYIIFWNWWNWFEVVELVELVRSGGTGGTGSKWWNWFEVVEGLKKVMDARIN